MKAVGPLFRAQAPGSFTFSSHMAMFVGFTPGIDAEEPYANPHFARIFRLAGGPGGASPWVQLSGRDIVDGLQRLGYLTVGTGAVRWFDPNLLTSRALIRPFERFFYPGSSVQVRRQVEFIETEAASADRPVFAFMNVGETHVPYWHEGASWEFDRGPCRSFQDGNDAQECAIRQRACLEFVDKELASLLDRFSGANVIICADHGDAWGEDGQWGHGFNHSKVLEVPLIFRLTQPPLANEATRPRQGGVEKAIEVTADALAGAARRLNRLAGRSGRARH
jgi:hypothetical protein